MSSLRLADRAEAPYYLPLAQRDRALPSLPRPLAPGHAEGPDRVRQDAIRRAHGVTCSAVRSSRSPATTTSPRAISPAATSSEAGHGVVRRTAHHRGAHRRDLLPRRGGRGATGHARRHPSGHRRPAHPADREDGGAPRPPRRGSSSSSRTTRATSTRSRTSSRARASASSRSSSTFPPPRVRWRS